MLASDLRVVHQLETIQEVGPAAVPLVQRSIGVPLVSVHPTQGFVVIARVFRQLVHPVQRAAQPAGMSPRMRIWPRRRSRA